MQTSAVAAPLTVWAGSTRYTFSPGRDITVGRDDRADIPLDNPQDNQWTSRIHVLLRFDGNHWLAIDTSRNGIYVDDERVSTVNIRDGQTITLADPRRGPRLLFRLGTAPPPTRQPDRPSWRQPPRPQTPPRRPSAAQSKPRQTPSQQPTRPMRAPAPASSPAEPASQLPTEPIPIPHVEAPASPPAPPLSKPEPSPLPAAPPQPASLPLPAAPPPAKREPPPRPASPPPAPPPAVRHSRGLQVQGQERGDVSFTAAPGTLTAVIGPAGSGKTSLIEALGGIRQTSSGAMLFDGEDVSSPGMHRRVGVVPHHDGVHPQLTVEQAVRYAAELRLPPETSADERRRIVHDVLGELELIAQRTLQIANLSPEKRKRASIAAELVTGPSLLVLDEPTAGLNATEERQLMTTLRRLADAGRVIVLATTSMTYGEMCDQLVQLPADGARTLAGPPPPPVAPVEVIRLGRWRQFAVEVRRQAWVVVGNQRYFVFLTILPIFFGALALTVPGHTGFAKADLYGDSPDEAVALLVVLILGAVVMGTASTIRDRVGDRGVFARERFLGLSPSAHLGAKVVVYSLIAIIQTAITTTAAVVGQGAPTASGMVFGDSVVELYVSVAATAIVSAIIALALASLTRHRDQLLPIAVLVILLSLVFCGGTFPPSARYGFDVVSWFIPARWGFAAAASSVDLGEIDLLATRDSLWMHSPDAWVLDMTVLTAFAVAGLALLRWRLRLRARN